MIPFVKAHACGNDFLIIDEVHAQGRHGDLARALCSRHFGVGADGVEFLDRRGDGTNFLRLFNADGSEAELSGNGTRCVAAWLAYSEGVGQVVLTTHRGPRACRVVECADDTAEEQFRIETEMGVPSVRESSVVVDGIGEVLGATIDVGNPHFVLFTGDPEFHAHGLTWEELGARICTHKDFSQGTNVEFVCILNPGEIEFRSYERGVGPTTSSGTGTCASSAAAILLRGCARELTASSIGGQQTFRWLSNDAPMMLTGPAEIICRGEANEHSGTAGPRVPA